MEEHTKQKRFTIALPESIHNELTGIARDKGITSREIIIRSLKLGFMSYKIEDNPRMELLLREEQEDGSHKEKSFLIL